VKTVQRYIENTGRSPMYVGNTMIPPGEGKLVDVPDDTPAADPEPAGPNLAAQIAELLDLSVAKIVEQLPQLTHEALDLLETQEQGGKTRKTLLEAVAEERLRRSAQQLEAEQAERRAEQLKDAEQALLQARVAQANLPPDAPEADRQAGETAVAEAQAAVDALKPQE
jgi:hypothetical protein